MLVLAAVCAAGSGAALSVSASSSAASGPPVNLSAPYVAFYAPLMCGKKAIPIPKKMCAGIPVPSLVCIKGVWKGALSFSYMWLRNGAVIPGATKFYYVPTDVDAGTSIACKVTATNKSGSTSITSESVEVDKFFGSLKSHRFPDHFECYRVLPVTIGKFVTLTDQFGTTDTEVENAQTLCNPASKNQFGPREPRAHLVCYQTLDKTPVMRQPRVEISNQFGDVQALIQNPEQLCVPSLKREGRRAPPANPDPATLLDHYRCYRVVQAEPNRSRFLTLTDQFGTAVVVAGQLMRLCTPVSKNNERVSAPLGHLACYLIQDTSRPKTFLGNFIGVIKGPKKRRAAHAVMVRNQFGVQRMTTVKEDSVCVPSRKTVISPGNPNTPPGPTAPKLTAITVTPANTKIFVGATQQFTATGSYSDGTTQNLTMTVTWGTSNGSVASISNAAGSQGLATGSASGSAAISATMGTTTGSTTLYVSPQCNAHLGVTGNPQYQLGLQALCNGSSRAWQWVAPNGFTVTRVPQGSDCTIKMTTYTNDTLYCPDAVVANQLLQTAFGTNPSPSSGMPANSFFDVFFDVSLVESDFPAQPPP